MELKQNLIILLAHGVNQEVFKKTVAEKEKEIRFRNRLIIALLLLNVLQVFGWKGIQHDITLHYPPDLRSGATRKVGQIDDSEVYAFVGEVFTQLNTWQKDGEHDYPAKRKRLRAFMTHRFQKEVIAEIQKLTSLGEIQKRTRKITPLESDYYSQDKVEIKNGSTWIVHREYRIQEHLNNTTIKDVALRFKIRVVVYAVPHSVNPWQLAIDGFEEDPERIPELKGDLE